MESLCTNVMYLKMFHHIDVASRYLDIMDEILSLDPDRRLLYGAEHGYNEIVKAALQRWCEILIFFNYMKRLFGQQ